MPKQIVFCADGTWNGPGNDAPDQISQMDVKEQTEGDGYTNVCKLFSNLAGNVTMETRMMENEQEKELLDASRKPVQVSKYIHGVGDSRNPIVRVMGGTLGAGLTSRIIRGYTFLSRHYKPGDAIHISGFSRGAYTARALAGMVATVGLLNRDEYDPDDKREAYRRGAAAWSKSKQACLRKRGKLSEWANAAIQFAQGIHARKLKEKDLVADVPIQSVAVWDTVGAMGIPSFDKSDARVDLFQFTDCGLSEKVRHGFHAMAIDERRHDFPVTRWDPRPGVEQIWFIGAHSDVGGGYARRECGLSDVSLDWMMHKLEQVGVRYSDDLAYRPEPDPIGCVIHEPWARMPFSKLRKTRRSVEKDDWLHSSVHERWNSPSAYRPDPLKSHEGAPACFKFVGK